MLNKIKILCQIIKLTFQIWQLDIKIWWDKKQWKYNDGTYTQVCLKCHSANQYIFGGYVPDKHICHHCGNVF